MGVRNFVLRADHWIAREHNGMISTNNYAIPARRWVRRENTAVERSTFGKPIQFADLEVINRE